MGGTDAVTPSAYLGASAEVVGCSNDDEGFRGHVTKAAPTDLVPRDDVRSGTVSAVDFAARLEQVVADPDAYADYGDPVRFFSLTYPTSGMTRLLTGVFGRLPGACCHRGSS